MKVCAIIPAGGQGTRMGGRTPKQFQALRGKPILHYTLRTLQESGLIDSLVLVVPEKELEIACANWLEHPPVVKQIVAGGEKRQDSVFNGYQSLPTDTDIVLVHDGVRPFLSKEMIQGIWCSDYGYTRSRYPQTGRWFRVGPAHCGTGWFMARSDPTGFSL